MSDDSGYFRREDGDAGEDVDEFALFRKNFYDGNQVSDHDQVYEFIIPGWLPAQGYSICNGKRGTGKSTFLIDMCARISCDLDWHGIRIDKGWTVVYIAAEDFLGVKQRMDAWRKEYLDNKPWPNDRFKVLNMAIDLCNGTEVEKFTRFINEMFENEERVLFIIDTWQRSVLSAKGQNDDASMNRATYNMENMVKSLRGAAILATHPPKSNEDTVLGSSLIENASQAIWQLSNYQGIRRAEVVRIKGCPDGNKIKFRFANVEMDGCDNLGNKLRGAAMEMLGGLINKPDEAANALPDYIGEIADVLANRQQAMAAHAIAEALKSESEYVRSNGIKEKMPGTTTIKGALGKLPIGETFEVGDGRRIIRDLDGRFRIDSNGPWEATDSQINIELPEGATIN